MRLPLLALQVIYAVAFLVACAAASVYVEEPVLGDLCFAACAHRLEIRCLEPELVGTCVPACNLATRRGWLDAAGIVRASRADMAKFNVVCLP